MDISIDTRKIKPGQYFIPVRGPNFNGREFINDAVKKGARVLDVELEPYSKKYRKKLNGYVIAVTGSAGKTTVKDLLYAVLKQKYRVTRTYENQNNEVGVPLTILRADYNTEITIVEMAMRNRGEITKLTQIARPTHVVITNVGLTHIENLKNMANIAKAKAEVFRKKLNWENYPRYAFINFSSPYHSFLQKKAEKWGYKVFPYSGQDMPDQNVNLCYSVGRHFGLSSEQIDDGLQQYQHSEHRLEVIKRKDITIIDDTYNANPDGVKFALQYLRRFKGRKILALADMLELGEHSKEEHLKVIPTALDAGVSLIFTLGPLASAIQSKKISVYNFFNKDKFQRILINELKPGDVVLVKGSRNMKMEEIVEAVKRTYA